MRLSLLFPPLLAAIGAASPAFCADSPQAAELELEICRLPGMPAEYSGREIDIPAGAAFAPAGGLIDPTATGGPAATPLRVTLVAPVSIAASAFCVRAPVRPVDPAQNRALHARIGEPFWVSGGLPGMRPGALDVVYGLLRSKEE